ncbi:hypothetical protein F53441_5301 [Fusarium austroafricanum]|uniref:5'-3' DNA helicase ZGRF1-like N-terminal domain-containing protein n=1 Tax=Fusarium austroafricanum TaxID=2364996 RepID=A0A8H4KK27_9HYPO|nr:hypothetical protein F53441_5301 [Fusarium austroafricanum]
MLNEITFNRRVMVYDDRNHFIGDAHWQEGGDLEPGDEFELDRGAAIVQVSDCTGEREQDLTELLDKRAKEVEKRRANAGTRTPGSTAAVTHTPRNDQNAPHFQLRHRPLNDLVGGASRIGRAVISPHSPYEVRKMAESPGQQQDSPSEDARSSKRRKREESPPSKMGHARALFGTTLTLTPFPSSIPAARSQPPSNPEETEVSAPRQAAPRRVFTQRASLRELLAGNEHNRHPELPQPREGTSKNRSNVSKQVRPQLALAEDNVISLLTQESHLPKLHGNAAQKVSHDARSNRDSGTDKPYRPQPSGALQPETVDSDQGQKQPSEADDDAFLNWLAQSEDIPPSNQTPVPPTDSRLPHSKKARGDAIPTIQKSVKEPARKIVQEPIVVDEDEDVLPISKNTQTRPQNTVSKPSKIREATMPDPHGTKRTLSADQVSTTGSDGDKPPPAKEPRTELRIRSRQRRGLLMLAQSKQGDRVGSAGRSRPSSSGAGSDAYTTSHALVRPAPASEVSDDTQKNTKNTPVSKKKSKPKSFVRPSESHLSAQELENSPADNVEPIAAEKVRDQDSDDDSERWKRPEDDVVPNDDTVSAKDLSEDRSSASLPRRRINPSRHTRKKAPPVVLSEDGDEEMTPHESLATSDDEKEDLSANTKSRRKSEPEPSSGPRIAKMSRKSVKSKEIIGFVMPPEEFPTAGFNIGHVGLAETEKPDDNCPKAEISSDKAQGASKMSSSTKSISHQLVEEQPLTKEKQPEAKQPPVKARRPEPVQPAMKEKEPEIVQPLTKEKEAESIEPPTDEKQARARQPQTKEKQPEAVQPATIVRQSATAQSSTNGRQNEEEEPSANKKVPEVAQPSAHGKEPQEKQRPRLVNPATRGRKAARKQDAAGLPPQSLVQLEAVAPSRFAPERVPKKTSPVNNIPQSELPVFCRANGGAWSRHAEDLLGMTRPSRGTSRRGSGRI